MNNFIELNIKDSTTSLSMIDNEACFKPFKTLRSNLALFPDERLDMPSKRIYCVSCGIRNDIKPIAVNGYCKVCNEMTNFFNL